MRSLIIFLILSAMLVTPFHADAEWELKEASFIPIFYDAAPFSLSCHPDNAWDCDVLVGIFPPTNQDWHDNVPRRVRASFGRRQIGNTILGIAFEPPDSPPGTVELYMTVPNGALPIPVECEDQGAVCTGTWTPEEAAWWFEAAMRVQPEMFGGTGMSLNLDEEPVDDVLMVEFSNPKFVPDLIGHDPDEEFQRVIWFWDSVKLALACIKGVTKAFILAQAEMTFSMTFGTDGWSMTMTTQTDGPAIWHVLERAWDCLQA